MKPFFLRGGITQPDQSSKLQEIGECGDQCCKAVYIGKYDTAEVETDLNVPFAALPPAAVPAPSNNPDEDSDSSNGGIVLPKGPKGTEGAPPKLTLPEELDLETDNLLTGFTSAGRENTVIDWYDNPEGVPTPFLGCKKLSVDSDCPSGGCSEVQRNYRTRMERAASVCTTAFNTCKKKGCMVALTKTRTAYTKYLLLKRLCDESPQCCDRVLPQPDTSSSIHPTAPPTKAITEVQKLTINTNLQTCPSVAKIQAAKTAYLNAARAAQTAQTTAASLCTAEIESCTSRCEEATNTCNNQESACQLAAQQQKKEFVNQLDTTTPRVPHDPLSLDPTIGSTISDFNGDSPAFQWSSEGTANVKKLQDAILKALDGEYDSGGVEGAAFGRAKHKVRKILGEENIAAVNYLSSASGTTPLHPPLYSPPLIPPNADEKTGPLSEKLHLSVSEVNSCYAVGKMKNAEMTRPQVHELPLSSAKKWIQDPEVTAQHIAARYPHAETRDALIPGKVITKGSTSGNEPGAPKKYDASTALDFVVRLAGKNKEKDLAAIHPSAVNVPPDHTKGSYTNPETTDAFPQGVVESQTDEFLCLPMVWFGMEVTDFKVKDKARREKINICWQQDNSVAQGAPTDSTAESTSRTDCPKLTNELSSKFEKAESLLKGANDCETFKKLGDIKQTLVPFYSCMFSDDAVRFQEQAKIFNKITRKMSVLMRDNDCNAKSDWGFTPEAAPAERPAPVAKAATSAFTVPPSPAPESEGEEVVDLKRFIAAQGELMWDVCDRYNFQSGELSSASVTYLRVIEFINQRKKNFRKEMQSEFDWANGLFADAERSFVKATNLLTHMKRNVKIFKFSHRNYAEKDINELEHFFDQAKQCIDEFKLEKASVKITKDEAFDKYNSYVSVSNTNTGKAIAVPSKKHPSVIIKKAKTFFNKLFNKPNQITSLAVVDQNSLQNWREQQAQTAHQHFKDRQKPVKTANNNINDGLRRASSTDIYQLYKYDLTTVADPLGNAQDLVFVHKNDIVTANEDGIIIDLQNQHQSLLTLTAGNNGIIRTQEGIHLSQSGNTIIDTKQELKTKFNDFTILVGPGTSEIRPVINWVYTNAHYISNVEYGLIITPNYGRDTRSHLIHSSLPTGAVTAAPYNSYYLDITYDFDKTITNQNAVDATKKQDGIHITTSGYEHLLLSGFATVFPVTSRQRLKGNVFIVSQKDVMLPLQYTLNDGIYTYKTITDDDSTMIITNDGFIIQDSGAPDYSLPATEHAILYG